MLLPPHRHITRAELREWLLFATLVTPNLLLFGVFTFWPLVYNGYLSLTQWDMLSPVKLWVGGRNYLDVFQDAVFRKAVANTFYFTAASVLATSVLGLFGALLLNQRLRGRDAVRTLVFAPVMLSGAAIGIVWIYIFDPRFGLIDAVLEWVRLTSPHWLTDPRWSMPGLILVYTWKNVGYALVIFIAGLQSIPKEIIEAARVDGADAWPRFRHVILPGLSPVMFFLILTSTLTSIQAFDIIKTMTGGGPVDSTSTLVYYLYEQGFVAFNAGKAGVASVVLFALMLAFTVVQMGTAEQKVHYT